MHNAEDEGDLNYKVVLYIIYKLLYIIIYNNSNDIYSLKLITLKKQIC
jgi:hypothetical protein